MNVLMFSADRKIWNRNSEVQKRISAYGSLFEELHIIVFAGVREDLHPVKINENVFVYPANYRYKFSYLWNVYKIAKSIIKERGISAITCQDPYESGLAGWILAKIFKIHLQLQVHTDVFSPYFWKESASNKIRVLLAKFLLPRANAVRTVSERIKSSFKSEVLKLKAAPTVLPVFVDVKKIQSIKVKTDLHEKYPDFDYIIFMASRLTREKNIGMAIRAMQKISGNYPKTLLLIVGDGPELGRLKIEREKFKVNNNVRFEYWTDDLISYYKTAELFLLTSNYEGYGRTVIEAMAAGLPVTMTDVGLAREILVDDLDGKIISVGDDQALVKAVLEIISDKRKSVKFKENALKLLEKFPSKKDYLKSYKKALEVLS